MRVVAAGCFVFAGLIALVLLLGGLGVSERGNDVLLGGAFALAMIVLCVAAMWLFNAKDTNALGLQSPEEQLQKLESAGLLEATGFRARRAFGVEEFEDEGLHYYIELEDRSVLFLSGQYLYDFEPIDDDPDWNQPRRFPCTDFTILRHKAERYVLDIQCRGEVLEPELAAPPFRKTTAHADGEVIRDTTYDALKSIHPR